LSLDPSKFGQNEAWILFRLNDAPVRTERDGDFNAMAIMEVSSGMIFGMELIPVADPQISEIGARRLLSAAAEQAGGRPASLYVASGQLADQVSIAATTMGIAVRHVPEAGFIEIVREARDSFAAHVTSGRMQ
jgi:hypothetical protein